jgi:hypothetical protein
MSKKPRSFEVNYEKISNSLIHSSSPINGYLDGYGTLEDLLKELPSFGISQAAGKKLIEVVKMQT